MTETAVPSLTTRTRVALAIARGIAASRGDDDLSPEPIALGLLREGGRTRQLRHSTMEASISA